MTDKNLKLLESVSNIKRLFVQNNIDLTTNISIKRKLIDRLNSQLDDPHISPEIYDKLIEDIFESLESSTFDEDYIITTVREYSSISKIDSIDLCLIILQEIGNNLILTGDYIHPEVSLDPNNPVHSIKNSLIDKTGEEANVRKNAKIQKDELLPPRLLNIPTDKERSPSIFNVDGIDYDVSKPFTQQLLLFEELGRININNAINNKLFMGSALNIPQPDQDGYPILDDLITFKNNVTSEDKGSNLGFEPMKYSNINEPNPWADRIRAEIDPPDFIEGVAEGRAPGLSGRHHKWSETNPPQIISITCQTGVVENDGARDSQQSHSYKNGEFGPGGLYHKALNIMEEGGTTKGIKPKFHVGLPQQKKESLWTFDGTFPPKLLMTKYGDAHILRHYNFLPIDPTNNRGFGLHTITTHEHNGPSSSGSDGFAQSYFFPGQYYDYLYPMTLSGHSYSNVKALNPKAASPQEWETDSEGKIVKNKRGSPIPKENKLIPGDWKETMSTHWFHDHMLDYTAQNVYKGNAAMMNYYSAIDRGNEEINDGVNLRFPSGTSLSWGNRDYDVNLAVMDKAWDNEGQLWFNPFNTNGFLGDRMLVNWVLEPYFEVRARRYRFRILNAGVSRFLKIALVKKFNDSSSGSIPGPIDSNTSYESVPLWLIANCGNIMMHSVNFDGSNGTTKGILPVQAIAERLDIIIDFGQFDEGDELYFVNVLEHLNGKRPNKDISLHSILNGTYGNNGSGDPCVMKFMEFRVKSYTGEDLSMDPSLYEVGKNQMIPIEPIHEDEIRNAVQRNFNFVNKPGTVDEWAIETDGGQAFQADMRRLSARPTTNKLELWTLRNGAPTWAHNVHIHYTEGKIILRDNQLPPIWEQFARKDVYRVGGVVDSSESMVIALKFNDSKADQYMMHCHNTIHEDHQMLLRFDVCDESCVKNLPCPIPTWQCVKFMETKTLPTFRTGMTKDNIFYQNPGVILHKLRQIDLITPDKATGSYFVNGIGKGLQLAEDD